VTALEDADRALLDAARRATLATIDPQGRARLVPVCFVVQADGDILWSPLDEKPKTAADVLRQYGTLEAALEAGRFAVQAEELRVYRRMATLDAEAPLPPLDDQTPAWKQASAYVRELGLNALAERLMAHAST
jgi:DNA polymerase-1